MSFAIDRLRILIVEDDEDSAELLSETFQERGHSLEVCRNGGAALEVVARFLPHVAVLDVGLPDMSGYELAQRMRILPGLHPRMRLIALTGYGGEEERARAHDAGFDAHFLKPVHPDVLVQAVEAEYKLTGSAEVPIAQDVCELEAQAGENRS